MKTDIDIDLADRDQVLKLVPHIAASINNLRDGLRKHNTGVYFQNISVHPQKNVANIDYDTAEDLGYFKIDFLNNAIYQGVKDEAHLDRLTTTEPMWELLDDPEAVSLLVHVHDHFDVVSQIKPQSVEDLAVVLALIRPAKRWLVYKDRATIDRYIWSAPDDGSYHFKKAHAVAYALSIVVQMNLIVEQALQ